MRPFKAARRSGSFLFVMPGRVAYLLAVNSLDSVWVWVCNACARRYQTWAADEIESATRYHQCPREVVDVRWVKASRHRFRSK